MKLLFVCLGNICRSPTAEGVMRTLLAEKGLNWIEVDSAGTAAYHLGKAPDTRAQRAAKGRGYDLSSLRARQVIPSDFDEFDYIFAMDSSNLSNLMSIKPKDSRAVVELALAKTDLNIVDVPDPYYGGAEGFEEVIDLCEVLSRTIIDELLADPS